jgi:DNA-binding transcriptional LysR family regulator
LRAAPGYRATHGAPATTAEQPAHHCITHAFGTRAEYRLGYAGRVLTQAVQGSLSSYETAVVKQAALAGAGIAMLPACFVGDELRRGRLVRVLPAYEPETLGIHAVFLSRQHQRLPLKLLVDCLAERFGGNAAPWDVTHSRCGGRVRLAS